MPIIAEHYSTITQLIPAGHIYCYPIDLEESIYK
jgi:hypothetical protein